MAPPKYPWFDRSKRREQLDDHIDRERMTNFGFRRVAAEDKVRWVARHFDRVAPKYDFMNTLLSFGIHHFWKRNAVRWMRLRGGAQVLDVCGGTGDLALLAADAVGPRGHVVVYDINRAMMQAGRPKIEAQRLKGRIRFVQGDAEQLAFPDASFDAAMVGFGIRNVTRMQTGFREMHRVLRPGGTFMCLEFSKPTCAWFRWLYDLYSFRIMPLLGELIAGSSQAYACLPETIRMFPLAEELVELLESAGFRDATFARLTNGIATVHLARKGS